MVIDMSTQAAEKVKPVIEVSKDQLPLSCPGHDEKVWNMHPRVFLTFGPNGIAECPYCGARYQLKD